MNIWLVAMFHFLIASALIIELIGEASLIISYASLAIVFLSKTRLTEDAFLVVINVAVLIGDNHLFWGADLVFLVITKISDIA